MKDMFANLVITISLILVIFLAFLFFLSNPQTLIGLRIRLKIRKRSMDELAIKYGLKNFTIRPTLGDWLARRSLDLNTIEGDINNHRVKIIDIGHFSLGKNRRYWRRATFIEIDGKIIDNSYKSWRQKIGLVSYLLPIKKIEEILSKKV